MNVATSQNVIVESEAKSPYFSQEHDMLRDQVRRFVTTEIMPYAAAWEEAGETPRHVLKRLGELGLLGITYPGVYGGSEMDVRATVVLAEELGRSTFGGVAITVLVHTDMASVHIAHFGSEEQKAKWLPGVVTGEVLCAVAVTEPDAGSDVKGIRMKATRDGDDYILNGRKIFITNGVNADIYCVAAKTRDDDAASKSVSMFLVEKGTPGFNVSRKLDKHGWRSSDTAELVFDDVRIPTENLLGAEGRGFYAVLSNFQNERLILGAMAMGEAQAALDLTLEHVRIRRAFGQTLWDKQAIRQRIAMLSAKVAAARSFIYATAWQVTHGHDQTKEVSMIKALCGELVNEVLYDCVQFHGGMGYMTETAVERVSRDVRVHSIGGGATEVMLEEVAKRL